MLQMLLDGGEEVRSAVRSMRQLSFGGAPITDALFARAVEGFGANLTQVYGTCEAPHPVTVLQPEDYAELADPGKMAQSAGRASSGSDLLIVDDDGKALTHGQEGELWVRGAHMMDRYWADEQATADAFAPGGWYKTGDIAVIDETGFVSFRDRKRDLIITGGLNVYPSEVERVLAEHPGVKEVAVVSYPDDQWGEAVLACVVVRDGSPPSEGELIDWVGKHIAGYKKPRKVMFMTELPKGSTNKVLKRELKAQFWQGRERRIN
jgi:acyl-CoA synthetase (AMP-forming)/AMP-acid ligase II